MLSVFGNSKTDILKTHRHHIPHLLCDAYLHPRVHKPHSPEYNCIWKRFSLFITVQCTISFSSVWVVNAQYVSTRKRKIATTKNQSTNTMCCAFNPQGLWPSQPRISIYPKIIFGTPSFSVLLLRIVRSRKFLWFHPGQRLIQVL